MLLVDTREVNSKIFSLLDAQGIPYEKKQLLVGDFVDEEKGVCIERKTVFDFVYSMQTNHLQIQLTNMGSNFPYCYLIISGSKPLKEEERILNEEFGTKMFDELFWSPYTRHFKADHILGMLASVAVRYNVKILQVPNDNQLVTLVKKIIEKTGDGKSVDVQQVVKLGKTDTYLGILCQFNRISLERAYSIKEQYPTIGNLITALTTKEFKVKGIGPTTIQHLEEVLCV